MKALVNLRMIFKAQQNFEDEEDSIEDAVDLALVASLKEANGRRYLFRRSKYPIGKLWIILKMT
jgi:hypothetical protein